MRVRFLDRMRFLAPIIYSDSGGGPGIISWVSPWDPEGKGNGGGACQVIWDWTGVRDTYRTGYKGDFNLRLLDALGLRDHPELASILKSTLHCIVCYIVHILSICILSKTAVPKRRWGLTAGVGAAHIRFFAH